MNAPFEKQFTVVTPERVQLQLQTAGIGTRAIAHFLDNVLLGICNFLLLLLLVFGSEWIGSSLDSWANDYALAFLIIFFVVLNVGYYVGLEHYNGGQTLGKKWLGIRVVQENGQSATFISVLIRNFFRLIDFLPTLYFLGTMVMIFSKRDKRIGDMAAGTIVVVELQRDRLKRRRIVDKALEQWRPYVPDTPLSETARQQVGHEDWRLLSAYMERLPSLTDNKAAELGAPIARHLKAKLEAVESLRPMDDRAFLIWLYVQLRDEWEV
ncbi:RDD family protein [Paenibacillus contaminans]|uniref:RDD family protein n=1 Tax=Paenibacillus contaminans TaxID=450362 RepID=A0A329M922_9BACL|nr:RDD family protein [Paenibacillus contaminans]RAV16434.1 RDD family protein [Paenibacillus contaminans]